MCFGSSSCWRSHETERSDTGHYVSLQNTLTVLKFHCVLQGFKAPHARRSKATTKPSLLHVSQYYGVLVLPKSSSFVSSVQRTFCQNHCGLSICILANSSLAFLCFSFNTGVLLDMEPTIAQKATDGASDTDVAWPWSSACIALEAVLGSLSSIYYSSVQSRVNFPVVAASIETGYSSTELKCLKNICYCGHMLASSIIRNLSRPFDISSLFTPTKGV